MADYIDQQTVYDEALGLIGDKGEVTVIDSDKLGIILSTTPDGKITIRPEAVSPITFGKEGEPVQDGKPFDFERVREYIGMALRMAAQMGKDRPATTTAATAPKVKDAAETVPELCLTVGASCSNTNGQFVGLNKLQREKLGVDENGTVELVDAEGRSLGIFTVGQGSKNSRISQVNLLQMELT